MPKIYKVEIMVNVKPYNYVLYYKNEDYVYLVNIDTVPQFVPPKIEVKIKDKDKKIIKDYRSTKMSRWYFEEDYIWSQEAPMGPFDFIGPCGYIYRNSTKEEKAEAISLISSMKDC